MSTRILQIEEVEAAGEEAADEEEDLDDDDDDDDVVVLDDGGFGLGGYLHDGQVLGDSDSDGNGDGGRDRGGSTLSVTVDEAPYTYTIELNSFEEKVT